MTFVHREYAAAPICAAIMSLSAAALAQEHSDDVQPRITPDAVPSEGARASNPAALTNAPKNGAPEPGAARPDGPRHGPPGGPNGPPGGPPLDGPPPMAVGELRIVLLTRVDVAVNHPRFDDPFSNVLVGLGAATKVVENVILTTDLTGSYDARDPAAGAVSVLDAIIQLEPTPAFKLWLGRMVEPVDRSSLSGPWFMAPWYQTGLGYVDGQVALPHAGFLGRSNGATLWGTVLAGHLKYYAAAFDLTTPGESPMLAGRINLSLFSPEPEYLNISSYLGKDILAIGVGAQSKKNGSVNPMTQAKSDYSEVSADLLFERNLGGAGVVGVEGAYYRFTGDYERTSSSWLALGSYVLPWQVAGARLQPVVRVQQATPAAPGAPVSTLLDAQVSFLLKGYFARFALGYRWAHAGPLEASSVFLGFQFMQL